MNLLAPLLHFVTPLTGSANPGLVSYTDVTSEPTKGRLGSLSAFARDKYYWSPARVLRSLWGISANIPQQIEILRLMRLPVYSDFLRTNPRLPFRFLIRDYLVRGFSTRQRADCFLHHYRRLHSSMSSDLLHRTLSRSVVVFEARRAGAHIEISLGFSRPFEKEGELSLNLHVDGAVVFVLSFTVIPGWVVQSEAEECLLISRLQGTNGYYGQIRAATRALHDVGPAALLLAALHGFAKVFGISRMAGVSSVCQSSFAEELSVVYKSAYDDFFSEMGITQNSSGLFLGSIPLEDRPMSYIKRGHKIRTREKRELKRQIAEDVCLLLHRSGANRAALTTILSIGGPPAIAPLRAPKTS